jgi:hypothetical protein
LPTGATYEWVDDGIAPEVTYYYRIEAVDLYGVRARFGPVSAALPPFSPYRLFLPLVARN